MASNTRGICPPDYEKPLLQVLWETATHIVSHDRSSLMMYSYFSPRESRLSDPSCPSWVPDFTDGGQLPTLKTHRSIVSSLQPDIPTEVEVIDDYRTLQISAWRLGPCYVAFRFADSLPAILRQVVGLFDLSVDGLERDSPWNKIQDLSMWRDGFARSCFNSQIVLRRMTIGQICHTIDHLLAVLAGRETINSLLLDPAFGIIAQVAEWLADRAILILPPLSCFCLSTCDVEDGDLVVAAPAFNTPLVLRPETTVVGIGDGKEHYKMVHYAYVDGTVSSVAVHISAPVQRFHEELVEQVRAQGPQQFLIH
ncbi:hypothetical protein F5B20DRAFT_112491 [Whalleya microplaca]|nr:hypothetical protein F5B20DRAFT_112491 [Whalleya microplaca]